LASTPPRRAIAELHVHAQQPPPVRGDVDGLLPDQVADDRQLRGHVAALQRPRFHRHRHARTATTAAWPTGKSATAAESTSATLAAGAPAASSLATTLAALAAASGTARAGGFLTRRGGILP
jgi:hypothetical protein